MAGYRIRLGILIIILVPLGLSTKFYSGPGSIWIYKYSGDILYPMFWFFVTMFFRPNSNPLRISGLVFLGCTIIEFTQLIKTPLLETVRDYFIGRTLIGSGFDGIDIVYYLIGNGLGYLVFQVFFKSRSDNKP